MRRLSKVEDAEKFCPSCRQCPDSVRGIIERCACVDPKARMSAAELVNALNACIAELR